MLPRANSKAPPKPNSRRPPPPPPTLTWDGSRPRRPADHEAETDYTRYIGVLRSGYEQLARDVDRWNEKHSTNFEVKCATPVEKTPRLKPVVSSSVEAVALVECTTPRSGSDNDKSTGYDVRERAASADARSKTKPKTPEHVSQWSSSVSSKKVNVSPRIDVESLKPTKVYRQPGRSGWGAHTVSATRNNPTFVNRLIILPPLEDTKQPERSPRENVAPPAIFLTEDARRPGKRSERSPGENIASNSVTSDRMTPPKKRQTQSDVRNIFAVPRIPGRAKGAVYRRNIHSFSRLKPMYGRYSVNRTHGHARFSPYRALPRISGKRKAQESLLVSQFSAGERSLSDMTDVPQIRNLLEKRLEKLWFGAKTKFQMLSGKRRTD